MAERAHRLIDGPEDDLLSVEEIAKYLRLSVPTLKRLVQAGEFPRPIAVSDGVKVWDWKDAVYWRLRTGLRSRMRPAKPPKKRKQDQGGSGPDQSGSSGRRAKPDA